MISAHGHTWTDQTETQEYYERFCEGYTQADINMETFHKPICRVPEGDKNYGCGALTSYIVIDNSSKAKRKHLFLGLSEAGGKYLFEADGMLFIPVPLCVNCEAKQTGYRCGRWNQEDYDRLLAAPEKGPYTSLEVETYKSIFGTAYAKGRGARIQAVTDAVKGAQRSRYTPKKEAVS